MPKKVKVEIRKSHSYDGPFNMYGISRCFDTPEELHKLLQGCVDETGNDRDDMRIYRLLYYLRRLTVQGSEKSVYRFIITDIKTEFVPD